jgi:hypothetical protein
LCGHCLVSGSHWLHASEMIQFPVGRMRHIATIAMGAGAVMTALSYLITGTLSAEALLGCLVIGLCFGIFGAYASLFGRVPANQKDPRRKPTLFPVVSSALFVMALVAYFVRVHHLADVRRTWEMLLIVVFGWLIRFDYVPAQLGTVSGDGVAMLLATAVVSAAGVVAAYGRGFLSGVICLTIAGCAAVVVAVSLEGLYAQVSRPSGTQTATSGPTRPTRTTG